MIPRRITHRLPYNLLRITVKEPYRRRYHSRSPSASRNLMVADLPPPIVHKRET